MTSRRLFVPLLALSIMFGAAAFGAKTAEAHNIFGGDWGRFWGYYRHFWDDYGHDHDSDDDEACNHYHDSHGPSVPDIDNLSNDSTPHKSKTWRWSSEDCGARYRYVIDQNPDGVPTGEYRSVQKATQRGGNGTYYLHVQEVSGDVEGPVKTVSAILDNTRPVIAPHANVTVTGTGYKTQVPYTLPLATDTQDGSVTVRCSPPPNSMLRYGHRWVLCTARDRAGNVAHSHFRITVSHAGAGDISITVDLSTRDGSYVAEATSASGAPVSFHWTTSGSVGTVSCTLDGDDVESGDTFPIGEHELLCSDDVVEDSVFVIVEDTTPPVITLKGPASITLNAGRTYTEQGATVSDAVTSGITVDVGGDRVNTSRIGTYRVSYNAEDDAGNAATTVYRTVTIKHAPGGSGGGSSTWVPPKTGTTVVVPGVTVGTGTGSGSGFQFTHELRVGAVGGTGSLTGDDIKQLQIFLNTHGFIIVATGPGSPGNETNYFGPLTKAALVKFQEANAKDILVPLNLTQGTGIFGPITMKFINSLLSQGL